MTGPFREALALGKSDQPPKARAIVCPQRDPDCPSTQIDHHYVTSSCQSRHPWHKLGRIFNYTLLIAVRRDRIMTDFGLAELRVTLERFWPYFVSRFRLHWLKYVEHKWGGRSFPWDQVLSLWIYSSLKGMFIDLMGNIDYN